jgi:hypothetical protein
MHHRLTVAFLVLAACSQKPGQPYANEFGAGENLSVSNSAASVEANFGRQGANEAAAQAAANGPGTLPAADAGLRFVGRWAPSEGDCTSRAWRFTADALIVDGGPHCSFYKVDEAPGGYDIAAQCPTKEPVHTDLIKLRFAESARAMLVESNAISPMGLIYCGQ